MEATVGMEDWEAGDGGEGDNCEQLFSFFLQILGKPGLTGIHTIEGLRHHFS